MYPSTVNAGSILHLFNLFRLCIVDGVRPDGAYPQRLSPGASSVRFG